MQAFETSEYRDRVAGVQQLMADSEIDALLLFHENAISYLTGYEGYSSHLPQVLLIKEHGDPCLIVREIEVRNAVLTCWLAEDQIRFYGEQAVGASGRSGWDAIADILHDELPRGARVGAEVSTTYSGGGLGSSSLGVHEYRKLASRLGVTDFRDVTGLVARKMRIKSAQEITYITEAATVVDRAMLAGIDRIAVGTRHCDVAASIMEALCAGTDTIPGGPPQRPPTIAVGTPANAPHVMWSDDTYLNNQQTNFEIAAFRHRYACPLARTAYLGTPPPRLKEVHAAVLDGFEAAVDTLKPGVACSDVAQAFHTVFGPYGIRKTSLIGYSVGLDWIDGGATLTLHDHTEVQQNMVFHVVIGIFEKTEGYILSEAFRVGESGAERLSTVPRILFERS